MWIRLISPSVVLWEFDIQIWPPSSLCDQQRAVHTSKEWLFSSWEDDDGNLFPLDQKRNIAVNLKVQQLTASNWLKLWELLKECTTNTSCWWMHYCSIRFRRRLRDDFVLCIKRSDGWWLCTCIFRLEVRHLFLTANVIYFSNALRIVALVLV